MGGYSRWAVKVKSLVVLGSVMWGLAGSVQALLLEEVVLVPIRRCFAFWVSCLS